jgi:hypothetical protein
LRFSAPGGVGDIPRLTSGFDVRTIISPIETFNIFNAAYGDHLFMEKGVEKMNIQDDMITMKDGKVMVIRNDGMSPIDGEITLSDGTRVMPNGQVLMEDGTARIMQEGETIPVDQRSTDAEEMSDRQFKEAMEDEELRDDIK